MNKGVKCPLCGSWFAKATGYSAGDICENQSMVGRNPGKCSPEHPCPGVLVPVFDEEQDSD